jgi:hypothetical protein
LRPCGVNVIYTGKFDIGQFADDPNVIAAKCASADDRDP